MPRVTALTPDCSLPIMQALGTVGMAQVDRFQHRHGAPELAVAEFGLGPALEVMGIWEVDYTLCVFASQIKINK